MSQSGNLSPYSDTPNKCVQEDLLALQWKLCFSFACLLKYPMACICWAWPKQEFTGVYMSNQVFASSGKSTSVKILSALSSKSQALRATPEDSWYIHLLSQVWFFTRILSAASNFEFIRKVHKMILYSIPLKAWNQLKVDGGIGQIKVSPAE